MNTLVVALFGLSLPAMIIGNPFTYAFALLGLILAFSMPQVRDAKAIQDTLSSLGRSKLVWALALLMLALYIGTFNAVRPEYSVNHWMRVAMMAGVGGLLYHVFRQFNTTEQGKVVTWLVWGVQATYLIAFAIAVAQPWAFPNGYYGDKPWTETHLRFYSSVLAVVLPFCWMAWLKPGKDGVLDLRSPANRSGLLWACSSLVLVLLCAGRAGWLGVIASALVWLGVMKAHHGLKLPRLSHMTLLAAGTLAVSAVGYMTLYGMRSIKERIGVTIPDRGLGGGRLDIWNLAWDHVFDHPLFGIGVNGFRFIPGADYHPHNFVLQIWLEGGLVSLILTFVVLGLMACGLYKRGKTDVMGVAGLAALAGFVVCALTNKSIFNPEWLVVMLLVMPFAMASARGAKVAVVAAKPVVKVVPKAVVKGKKAGKKGKGR